jgi:hypothetical protein
MARFFANWASFTDRSGPFLVQAPETVIETRDFRAN